MNNTNPRTDGRRVSFFRPRTPNQYASLLSHLSEQSWTFVTECSSPAEAFEAFYTFIDAIVDIYFPTKSITIKEKDPHFMTPIVKHLIRRRNKLLRKNRVEAASAISTRINRLITRSNATTFERVKRG